MWDHRLDSLTIRARAQACDREDPDAFDLQLCAPGVTVLRDRGGEEVLIGSGRNAVRLSISEGTILSGPVRLTYALSGRRQLGRRLLALGQLEALMRLGRVPAGVRSPATNPARPFMLLRTLNALADDPSPRSVAISLFGDETVERDWGHPSDYLRMQTRRLVTRAWRLVTGGYIALVRGPP